MDDDPDGLRQLRDASRRGPVTLLFATKETEHNNAVALRDYLTGALAPRSGEERSGDRAGGSTKAQLYAQAKARGIRGRSAMSKEELEQQLSS